MAAKSPTKPRIDGSAYDILGLEPGADAGAIKKAYHKIAREWHPDVSKHKDAKDVFAHVARAYEILTNPRQRVWYDLFMDNQIPFGSLERFQELYARGVQRMGGDLLARHRHSIGWAVVGSLGLLVASVRMAVWRRHQRHAISRVEPELEGGATTSTTEWRPAYAVAGCLAPSEAACRSSRAARRAARAHGLRAAALAGALAGRGSPVGRRERSRPSKSQIGRVALAGRPQPAAERAALGGGGRCHRPADAPGDDAGGVPFARGAGGCAWRRHRPRHRTGRDADRGG